MVLQAFKAWEEKCLEWFTGMFACAIYNQRKDTLTLIRDRFGTKPLYYTVNNGHTFFASELKPLLSNVSYLRPNEGALREWSLYRMVLPPEELIHGIYSVPPGHFLQIHQGQVSSPHCYYSPISEVQADLYTHYAQQPLKAIVSELSTTLDRSVQDCLTGDVPVGVLCSGGVDSSLLTALAGRQRDVMAFHVAVPDEPTMDEHREAENVTRFLGVPLVCRSLDRATFLKALPRVLYLNEAPLTHIQTVAFYLGVRLAHEHGAQVLLVGDAADTVLGGNWSRQWVLLHLRQVLAHLPQRLHKALEDTVAAHNGIPVRPFLNPHGVNFLDRYSRESIRQSCMDAYEFVTDATDRAILATKLAHLIEDVSWYLQRGDRLGMAESVEYRVPFLDHRLVRMAVNLPWSYQTRGLTEKWALKQVALQFLTRRMVYRKKVPWDLPLRSYLEPFACRDFFEGGICLEVLGLHRKAIEMMVEDHAGHLQSFFNLVNLELWGRLFLLGQTVEQVEEFCTAIQINRQRNVTA